MSKVDSDAKPFDPNFKGPIQNRGCTDVICCVVFLVCIGGYAGICYFALTNGDPARLLYPTDSYGNVCGSNNAKVDLTDKKYLFFFDLTKCSQALSSVTFSCPTPQVCVEECPTSNFVGFPYEAIYRANGDTLDDSVWEQFICTYDVTPSDNSKSPLELMESGECAPYYLESGNVLDRCVPEFFLEALDAVTSIDLGSNDEIIANGTVVVDASNNSITYSSLEDGAKLIQTYLNEAYSFGMKVFTDVENSWKYIVISMFVAMFLSFFMIVLMRWIAGPIVILLVIVTLVSLAAGSAYSFNEYFTLTESDDYVEGEFLITSDLTYYLTQSETWLGLAITAAVIFLILLLIIIFLISRIRLAICLIGEASKAVANMTTALLFPIIPFVLQLGMVAFFAVIAVYLASTGSSTYTSYYSENGTNITTNGSDCSTPTLWDTDVDVTNYYCLFSKYGGEDYLTYLHIYNLFMFFWLTNFFIAVGQCTLAGAFASWYWAFSKPADIPWLPVLGSFWRVIRYHIGTLALGSFIIAVVQLIRIFLEYIDQKLKKAENQVAKFIMKCLKCCFWCLEKFLRFINKNAYIMVAVHGKNFCFSAKDAFCLLARNCIRVVVLNNITAFLLFIAKIAIVASVAVLAFMFFSGRVAAAMLYVPTLNYFWVPVVLIFFGSYIIAAVFFDVYDMAIDTLFLCFCEDCERNDGTSEKPYFMSQSLMKVCGKKNKFYQNEDDKSSPI